VLRLGNQSRQTREKEASTNPTWEEQFSLLCDDPTIAELNVSVSRAVCGFFTHSHHCDHVIVIVLCDRCRRCSTCGFFERPFVERFILFYETVVCLSVCNVGLLWPNCWMGQDATGYGYCVRWGLPLPPPTRKGHSNPRTFWPMSIVTKRLDGSGHHFVQR